MEELADGSLINPFRVGTLGDSPCTRASQSDDVRVDPVLKNKLALNIDLVIGRWEKTQRKNNFPFSATAKNGSRINFSLEQQE